MAQDLTYEPPTQNRDDLKKDIERQKCPDISLWNDENSFLTFFTIANDFLFILDKSGNILKTNSNVVFRLGYSDDELIGKNIFFVYPEESKQNTLHIINNILRGKTGYCNTHFLTKTNHQIPVETFGTKGTWFGEDVTFLISKDLTKLKESEEKFTKAFQVSTAPMIFTTLDEGYILDVNEAYLNTMCFTKNEVIGKSIIELNIYVHPRDRVKIIQEVKNKGFVKNYGCNFRTKNGDLRYGLFFIDTVQMENKVYLLTVMNDITDRKKAEKELKQYRDHLEKIVGNRTAELKRTNQILEREIKEHKKTLQELKQSEESYRKLFEQSNDAVFIHYKGKIIDVNQRACEMFKYTKEQMIGMIIFRDLQFIASDQRLIDASEGKAMRIETQLIRADGSVIDTEVSSRVFDISHSVVQSIVRDITEQKRAQAKLLESERKYRSLFEQSNDAILIHRYGKIIDVNEKACEIFGYTRDQLTNMSLYKDFYQNNKKEEAKKRLFAISKGKPMQYETKLGRSDGSFVDVEISSSRVLDKNQGIIQSIIRDITIRKKTEESLEKNRQELEIKSQYLEEANTALKVLLKHREEDKVKFEKDILSNVRELILPSIEQLKSKRLTDEQLVCLNILETNLENIISPFLSNITLANIRFTPQEIKIANLIKEGKTSKEIAKYLGLTREAVDFHRSNIRKKLDLNNKRVPLRSYLLSLT